MQTATRIPIEAPFVSPAELSADPHGGFAKWRARTPMIRVSERRYTVLRGADVMELARDPRAVQISGADYVAVNGVPEGASADLLRDFFLFDSGAEHRRKRGPFAKTFAHAAIKALRPKIRVVAEQIVAEAPRNEPFDFVARIAARVPAEMIAEILGLPVSDASYFAGLVYRVARMLAPEYPLDQHEEIEAASVALRDYVASEIALRRGAARDDLLSELVAAAELDAAEDPDAAARELTHQVMGVIIGGSDTTRAGLAMTVALLLQHPEQWRALREDETLLPGAVSEGLRFEPPVGTAPRFAAQPMEIGGVPAPAGVMLALSTLSAMRDPEIYAEPDRFDIRRTDHPKLHMVFGGGAHRCLGEALARIEMEEALRALTRVELDLLKPPTMFGFGGVRSITPMILRIL